MVGVGVAGWGAYSAYTAAYAAPNLALQASGLMTAMGVGGTTTGAAATGAAAATAGMGTAAGAGAAAGAAAGAGSSVAIGNAAATYAAAQAAAAATAGAGSVSTAASSGAAAASAGAAAFSAEALAAATVCVPMLVLVGAEEGDNHNGLTWDCWKAVLRDTSTEPSQGMTLGALLSDDRIQASKSEGYRGMLTVTNKWGETFDIKPVTVPGLGLAYHCEPALRSRL